VSSNSQVCDAIVDSAQRNSVAKLLGMTSSTDERVSVLLNVPLINWSTDYWLFIDILLWEVCYTISGLG